MTNKLKSNLELKQHLFNECCQFIENRLKTIKNTMLDIKESLDSETKSSAGDKHETGRAMLQIELEKAGNQLNEIQKIKEVLSMIDVNKTSETVRLGSVVFTSKANYFIAISAGSIIWDNQQLYAIAIDTPIGQLLTTKKAGDEVIFREEKIRIKNVF
jgi:transcription elongation GreA/GreB family factor